MVSDDNTARIPTVSAVHATQAPSVNRPKAGSGQVLPPTGKVAASRAGTPGSAAPTTAATSATAATAATAIDTAKPAAQRPAEPQALVNQLNRNLNDSGLPDQFRLDPSGKLIQQVNPTTGEVISQLPVSEFPALARGVGSSGLLLDTTA
jgi:hypothetical protein